MIFFMKLSILIKKTVDLLDRKLTDLILIAFFLIRIAPFTLPYLSLGIYSHYLYRIINFIIVGLVILSQRIKNKKIFDSFILLSVVYFLFQAFSVFGTTNLRIFFINFEKIFSSLFFLLALYPLILEKGNKLVDQLINVIIISTALNVLVELSMIIVPGISLKILTLFVHPGVIDIIKTNLQRGRVYFEFYDEISIPILFYLYFVKKNNRYLRGCSLLLLFGIVFISFFSNIRTRFLVTVFVLLGSFFIFRKFFSKNLLKILGVLVGVI